MHVHLKSAVDFVRAIRFQQAAVPLAAIGLSRADLRALISAGLSHAGSMTVSHATELWPIGLAVPGYETFVSIYASVSDRYVCQMDSRIS